MARRKRKFRGGSSDKSMSTGFSTREKTSQSGREGTITQSTPFPRGSFLIPEPVKIQSSISDRVYTGSPLVFRGTKRIQWHVFKANTSAVVTALSLHNTLKGAGSVPQAITDVANWYADLPAALVAKASITQHPFPDNTVPGITAQDWFATWMEIGGILRTFGHILNSPAIGAVHRDIVTLLEPRRTRMSAQWRLYRTFEVPSVFKRLVDQYMPIYVDSEGTVAAFGWGTTGAETWFSGANLDTILDRVDTHLGTIMDGTDDQAWIRLLRHHYGGPTEWPFGQIAPNPNKLLEILTQLAIYNDPAATDDTARPGLDSSDNVLELFFATQEVSEFALTLLRLPVASNVEDITAATDVSMYGAFHFGITGGYENQWYGWYDSSGTTTETSSALNVAIDEAGLQTDWPHINLHYGRQAGAGTAAEDFSTFMVPSAVSIDINLNDMARETHRLLTREFGV